MSKTKQKVLLVGVFKAVAKLAFKIEGRDGRYVASEKAVLLLFKTLAPSRSYTRSHQSPLRRRRASFFKEKIYKLINKANICKNIHLLYLNIKCFI